MAHPVGGPGQDATAFVCLLLLANQACGGGGEGVGVWVDKGRVWVSTLFCCWLCLLLFFCFMLPCSLLLCSACFALPHLSVHSRLAQFDPLLAHWRLSCDSCLSTSFLLSICVCRCVRAFVTVLLCSCQCQCSSVGACLVLVSVCVSECVCACVCACVCLSVCLFVCLSVCLFVCLSVCLFVCLSVCLFVCLSVRLSVPSVCPSVRPIRQSVPSVLSVLSVLSVPLVCQSVLLSVRPSVGLQCARGASHLAYSAAQ